MYIFMLVQKQKLQRYKYNSWVCLIYKIVMCRSYIQSINKRVNDKFNLQFEPQMTKCKNSSVNQNHSGMFSMCETLSPVPLS